MADLDLSVRFLFIAGQEATNTAAYLADIVIGDDQESGLRLQFDTLQMVVTELRKQMEDIFSGRVGFEVVMPGMDRWLQGLDDIREAVERDRPGGLDHDMEELRLRIREFKRLVEAQKTLASQLDSGRVTTYSAYAVVTSLLASVEATLLTGGAPFTPSKNGVRGNVGVQSLYVFVTYGALIFSLGATISSVFVIETMTVKRPKARAGGEHPRRFPTLEMRFLSSLPLWFTLPIVWFLELLIRAGSWSHTSRRADRALQACFSTFFTLCMLFVIAQLLAHVWLYESTVLSAVLTPLVAAMAIPYVVSIII